VNHHSTIVLEDWQDRLADDALARIQMAEQMELPPVRHGIQSATGSGKTEIAMSILKRRMDATPKDILPTFGWLAERTLLLEESRERINTFFGENIAVNNIDRPLGSRALAPGRINMLSPQTFVQRGDKNVKGRRALAYDHVAGLSEKLPWDILIADEAHHSIADYYGSCIRAWPGPVIGLSGTWWCMSDFNALGEGMAGGGVSGPFDTLSMGPEPKELVGTRLSDIDVFNIDSRLRVNHFNLKQNSMTLDGYDGASVDAEVEGRLLAISSSIVHEWERAGRVPCLSFLRTKAAAHKCTENFQLHGYRAATILSETPEQERREKLDALNAGDIDWISSVDVFGEGVNVPNVRCIAMIRPTKSLIRHRQFLGRGLRRRDDDSPLLVLDFANNILTNGSPLEGWSQFGLAPRRTKRKPGAFPLSCPKCETSVNWNQEFCHGEIEDPHTRQWHKCGEPLSWQCEDDVVTLANGLDIEVSGCHTRHWCGNFDKRSKKACSEAIEAAISAEFVKQQAERRRIAELERQEREEKRRLAELEEAKRREELEAKLQEDARITARERLSSIGPEWRWEWERTASSNFATLKLKDAKGGDYIAMAIRNQPMVIVLDPEFQSVKLSRPDGRGFGDEGPYQSDMLAECQIASKMIHDWNNGLMAVAAATVKGKDAVNVYI